MPTPEEEAAAQATQQQQPSPIEVAFQQAVAAAEAKAAAAEQARLAAEAKLAEKDKAPIAPVVPLEPEWMAAARKKHETGTVRERIKFARDRNLDPAVMPDDIAAKNLPDFDPDAPDAEAKFDAWRSKSPAKWFIQRGQDPAGQVAVARADVAEFKSPLFSSDKVIGSVFGGGKS